MKSLIVIVSCILLVGWFIITTIQTQHQHDNACNAKGGIPFRSRDSGFICLKPDAIINEHD